MKDRWITRTITANSSILKHISGLKADTEYELMWDTANGVLRVRDPNSGQQFSPIPLSSARDFTALLGNKTRDDLSYDEIKLLKSLSDARYSKGWTRYKQSNYEIKTNTDSTGFARDVLIKRIGGGADHIHIYVDTVSGKRGVSLTVVKNGKSQHYPLDPSKSLDDLINEFTP